MIKLSLLLSLLFFTFNSFGELSDWKIEEQKSNGEHFLVIKNQRFNIDATPVKPAIKRVEKFGDRIEVVVIYANAYGTSKIVEQFNGIVFDKKTNKFLGEFPFEYKDMEGKVYPKTQPEWNLLNGKLVIKEKRSATNVSFDAE
jgi:hypothetical protein